MVVHGRHVADQRWARGEKGWSFPKRDRYHVTDDSVSWSLDQEANRSMFIGEAHITKGPVDSPKRLLEATDGFATNVKHIGLHTGDVDPILPTNTVKGSQFIQFRGEQMFPRDNMR